jgi:FKBP-type peptidyl-prolyl cis-trans isomerase
MKKILILLVVLSIGIPGFAQKNKKKSTPPPPAFTLQTAEDSLAYAIGVLNYQSLSNELIKKYSLDIKLDVLCKGMADFSNDTLMLNPDQANQFLGAYMGKKEAQIAEAEKNAGKKFLEENVIRPGVYKTASGLQYEIIEMGTGIKPIATDRVKVHYTGTLIDGTVFDSSVERGEPVVFTLNQVIPGWTEGLQLMPVGSKFKFYIPSELGYGARSAGALIKPNSVLIFDIELISIEAQ